jgi:hypothetical protein
MLFEYLGFIVLWLAPEWLLLLGPGFRGYAKTKNEARQIIDIITAGHCVEE